MRPHIDPIVTLKDGTIKQVNPLSGTEVWTVPGRGNRPLHTSDSPAAPINEARRGRYCAFCSGRYFETPPEKARVIRKDEGWETLTGLSAPQLLETVAEFRRVPNLFEILSLDYWEDNHGYQLPTANRERMQRYLADPMGHSHVFGVAHAKAMASGITEQAWAALSESEQLDWADNFFAGGHDVIIARRHFASGATDESQLAGSGSLSVAEHREYTTFTIEAMEDLINFNEHVLYVATFQNWLRPAGASFDHLHKQLVAIDERGAQADREYTTVRNHPNIYNELAVDYASKRGLILADNAHAVAFAGFGHRYPALEIYSKSRANLPWEHTPEEIAAMSELLHACHAATGVAVPTNEEWYYRPKGVDVAMPWRVLIKWRVSTLAGFEGGTKINVNTISPFAVHDRVLERLFELRKEGKIAPMRLGSEVALVPNSLQYDD